MREVAEVTYFWMFRPLVLPACCLFAIGRRDWVAQVWDLDRQRLTAPASDGSKKSQIAIETLRIMFGDRDHTERKGPQGEVRR
jgi:hypothetical protein